MKSWQYQDEHQYWKTLDTKISLQAIKSLKILTNAILIKKYALLTDIRF